MTHQQNKITCPNCGFDIDVNDVLYHQVDQELKRKYDQAFSKEKARLESRESEIETIRNDLEKEKKKQQELITQQVETKIAAERLSLKQELQKSIEDEYSERQKLLEEELNSKSEQLKEYHKAKSEIERLKREKSELRASVEAESEKRLNELLEAEKAKIHKQEEQRSQLKLSEKEKVIEQLSQQLKEAQRKAEQGSTQLQGEVQELAIEDWLSDHFPLDTIEEIRKGARGADCIQTVNTRTRQNCGTIYYESKRTKGFQPGWIEKFRHDIREKNADIGVLVTESMPADMDRLGLKDGIWICSFEEFKGLCHVLRESVINLSRALSTQEGALRKMGKSCFMYMLMAP